MQSRQSPENSRREAPDPNQSWIQTRNNAQKSDFLSTLLTTAQSNLKNSSMHQPWRRKTPLTRPLPPPPPTHRITLPATLTSDGAPRGYSPTPAAPAPGCVVLRGHRFTYSWCAVLGCMSCCEGWHWWVRLVPGAVLRCEGAAPSCSVGAAVSVAGTYSLCSLTSLVWRSFRDVSSPFLSASVSPNFFLSEHSSCIFRLLCLPLELSKEIGSRVVD